MHEEVKRFHIEGVFGGSANQVQFKEGIEHWLETDMRDKGFVPVLDMDPQYTRHYDAENDQFKFELSIYGTEVGEKSWEIAGVMTGKTILRSIPQAKSSKS